ncbi:MAG: hypothetical protein ACKOEO_26245 [Planctomycetaceae bacterium]
MTISPNSCKIGTATAVFSNGFIDERQTIQNNRIILSPRGSRGETLKQPEPNLLTQIVERKRIFSGEVRIQLQRG